MIGVARFTEDELRTLDEARKDAELSERPAMHLSHHNDGRGFGFGGVMKLKDRYFPGSSLNFAPMLFESDRFENLSAFDALHELMWLERRSSQKNIRTIHSRDFFGGNTDEQSLNPFPISASFSEWRDALLTFANRPNVMAVGASVFDLPSPEHREDDLFWIQAECWYVWTSAPLKEIKQWTKPLKCHGVYKVPAYRVRAPNQERLPPKTYAYALVLAAQLEVPTRRCHGPIYRAAEATYAPASAEHKTMSEQAWHDLRERFIPSLDGGAEDLMQIASDAYHAFGRTGIPTPALWDSIERLLNEDSTTLKRVAVRWLWNMVEMTEAAERLWLAYDRGKSDLRLLIIQYMNQKVPLVRQKLIRVGLIDRSSRVRLFAADRIRKTDNLESELYRALEKETDARAKRSMELAVRKLGAQ